MTRIPSTPTVKPEAGQVWMSRDPREKRRVVVTSIGPRNVEVRRYLSHAPLDRLLGRRSSLAYSGFHQLYAFTGEVLRPHLMEMSNLR